MLKIGITYDLKTDYIAKGFSDEDIAEFDKEETIEAIDKALQHLGFETERIGNIYSLTKMLSNGKTWDCVFNISEGFFTLSRESQVPALLDAYNIPYTFSDPIVLGIALNKGIAKTILQHANINTPEFFVVENLDDIEKINITPPMFAKPIAEGTSKGISSLSKINSQKDLEITCKTLLEKFKQPVLVEKFLPGREFTVGVIGTGSDAYVIGMMEVLLSSEAEQEIYSYSNKQHYHGRVSYTNKIEKNIFDACKKVALDSWRVLGCRDGGRVDVRFDDKGNASFIEVNPLAGLHPIDSDLVIICSMNCISYEKLIELIMQSFFKRNVRLKINK